MTNIFTDPDNLAEQYKTQDQLAVRIRTHQLYTVPRLDLTAAAVAQLPWRGDELVVDVGCGNGGYQNEILVRTGRYVAADYSPGMLRSITPQPDSCLNLDAQYLPKSDNSIDISLANHDPILA